MANGIGVEEMRMTLARVAAYRKVCEQVRAGASSTMFTGAMFLGFAYLNYSLIGRFHPILYGQILLGVGELLARYYPSGAVARGDASGLFTATRAALDGQMPVGCFVLPSLAQMQARTLNVYESLRD